MPQPIDPTRTDRAALAMDLTPEDLENCDSVTATLLIDWALAHPLLSKAAKIACAAIVLLGDAEDGSANIDAARQLASELTQ